MKKRPQLSWVWNPEHDIWFGPYPDEEIDTMFAYLQDTYRKSPVQVVVDSKLVRRRVATSEENRNA